MYKPLLHPDVYDGDVQFASLPVDWKPYKGIIYPTTVRTLSQEVEVKNSYEHHKLIQKILKLTNKD